MERPPKAAALAACALALAVLPAGVASAASKPAVTTGGVADVASQTVTLTGRVDPNGAATTYFFQIGTTTLYGATTPTVSAGSGDSAISVTAAVQGLAPATRYHYRLVARNREGLVRGADRTFRTLRQPLGVSFAATPNPVPFGAGTTLAGRLTGTGNAGREVVLQANPFPYTSGFAAVGNRQLTTRDGSFAFPILSVPVATQYRVVMPEGSDVVSPVVVVNVAALVGTRTSATRVRRGRHVRFSGTLRPARDGAQIAIQKLRRGRWITVAGTIARHATDRYSRYAKRVRVPRGGTYRVYVRMVDGNYVSSVGRSVRIHTRR